jgi:hypothetical protein
MKESFLSSTKKQHFPQQHCKIKEYLYMLVFLLAQTKAHFEHLSTLEESYHVLVFPLSQEQMHLKQHHSIMEES